MITADKLTATPSYVEANAITVAEMERVGEAALRDVWSRLDASAEHGRTFDVEPARVEDGTVSGRSSVVSYHPHARARMRFA